MPRLAGVLASIPDIVIDIKDRNKAGDRMFVSNPMILSHNVAWNSLTAEFPLSHIKTCSGISISDEMASQSLNLR